MDADKAVVQLGKAFLFHVVSFHRIQDFREMGMNGSIGTIDPSEARQSRVK
jgi:hypothetical protein